MLLDNASPTAAPSMIHAMNFKYDIILHHVPMKVMSSLHIFYIWCNLTLCRYTNSYQWLCMQNQSHAHKGCWNSITFVGMRLVFYAWLVTIFVYTLDYTTSENLQNVLRDITILWSLYEEATLILLLDPNNYDTQALIMSLYYWK